MLSAQEIIDIEPGVELDVRPTTEELGKIRRKRDKVQNQRFRQNTFDRFFVEAALLVLTLAAVMTLVICAEFIVGHDNSPMFRLFPSLGGHVVRALAPMCTAHIVTLPPAFATYVAFGVLYLLAGGCPGTVCATMRHRCVRACRVLFALGLTVASFTVTWILTIGDLCALSVRSCAVTDSESAPLPFPYEQNLKFVLVAVNYIIVTAVLYVHFSLREHVTKKILKQRQD